MQPRTENRIVLITRKTRLTELIERFNTEAQARFYIEHLGADFADYKHEDVTYANAVDSAKQTLGTLGRLHVLDRTFLPNYLFGPADFIVVLGRDGLVANTLKYLGSQPVVGVNPDPGRWDGILLPFTVKDLPEVLPEVFSGKMSRRQVAMAQATLNNGLSILAVNDLFIGPKSHGSLRYTIRLGNQTEPHSSSGIIVSTGLGSTGWYKSIVAGTLGISNALAGHPQQSVPDLSFPWESRFLRFSVREPFPSKTSAATLLCGEINDSTPLVIDSHVADSGVIFSDGIESDFLDFNSGSQATVTVSNKSGILVQ